MSGRVRLSVGASSVLLTRTLGLALTATTILVLARSLGPPAMGGYYLLVLVPPTMLALLSLGLPASLTYHTGRGDDLDEIRTLAVGLALAISSLVALALLALQPLLLSTVLAAAPPDLYPVTVLAVPSLFVFSFCNAVVLGRQRLWLYSGLLALQAVALFLGQVAVVAVSGAGLTGAIWTYVVVMMLMAGVSAAVMIRLAPFRPKAASATTGRLMRYGIVLQPATLAGFFNYRADVYLLSYLLRDSTAVGVYGLAVNLAELCFYIPDAVSTALFPRVAASSESEAAMLVPVVTRTVLLLTALGALALASVVVIGVPLVLPEFGRSIAPTLILLPGIIGLSLSKILSAYLTGSGHPGLVSTVSTVALLLNVAINIALIPVLGPVGAATASLVSYSAHGAMMVILGARRAHVRVRDLIAPRRPDLELVYRTVREPLARIHPDSRNWPPSRP